jgi:hypothetical protein
VVFSYYTRLSARQQAIYRSSDRVTELRLPEPERLLPLVETLRRALEDEDRKAVALAARALSGALLGQLAVPSLAVKVLAVRPSSQWGELHGLYTTGEEAPAEIRLWMRTAQHKQVVAFRTFLRTLIHELCHHLDYRHLKLKDSYHTEGFFRRESSLFRQIAPAYAGPRGRRSDTGESRTPAAPPRTRAPRPSKKPPVRQQAAPRRPVQKPPAPVEPRQRLLPFDPSDEG